MAVKVKPINNISLNSEKMYLEKQALKGLYLTRSGLFLYHFKKGAPASVSYDIQIIDKKNEETNSNLETIVSKNILFSKLKKEYYLTYSDMSNPIIHSEQELMYFKLKKDRSFLMMSIMIGMIFMTLILAQTPYSPSNNFIIGMMLLIIPFIPLAILSASYDKQVSQVSKALNVRNDEFFQEPNYVVKFNHITAQQKGLVLSSLEQFGLVFKIATDTYRLNTTVEMRTIQQHIIDTFALDDTSVEIYNYGDLNLLPSAFVGTLLNSNKS